MPFEPFERVAARPDRPRGDPPRVRRRHRSAGSSAPVADDDAVATVRARLGRSGIRYFDVAPLYGYGAAERRIGRGPRGPAARRVRPVDQGRPARPAADAIPPGADIDRQALDGRDDAFYAGRRRPPDRLRLQRRRASAARSRRASSGSASTGSTSPSSTTPTTTGRRRSRAPIRRSHRLREAGRRPGDRRRDEPVADARPVRPRGRHRRVPARRPLHAARPGRARRAPAALRRAGHRGARRRRDEQRRPRRPAARRAASTTARPPARSSIAPGGSAEACDRHERPAARRGDPVPARPSGRRRA